MGLIGPNSPCSASPTQPILCDSTHLLTPLLSEMVGIRELGRAAYLSRTRSTWPSRALCPELLFCRAVKAFGRRRGITVGPSVISDRTGPSGAALPCLLAFSSRTLCILARPVACCGPLWRRDFCRRSTGSLPETIWPDARGIYKLREARQHCCLRTNHVTSVRCT